jgi:hypothetical protein
MKKPEPGEKTEFYVLELSMTSPNGDVVSETLHLGRLFVEMAYQPKNILTSSVLELSQYVNNEIEERFKAGGF